MKEISILGSRNSFIHMEKGCFRNAEAWFKKFFPANAHFCVITDDIVAGLYGNELSERIHCPMFVFPHGETHKTMKTWAEMLRFLTEKRISRNDCVIALGGGVCGDLAGFAAASCRRGVHLVQIPTSLVAMADSSIGGKTGFDFAGEKNSIGAFYPPDLVLIDMELLRTLPDQQKQEGMAEIIKTGMIADESLFFRLENGFLSEEMLEEAVRIKADIVAGDELDKSGRRLLNFGHTFGHAIEEESGFQISHGHAVACGMVCAARLAGKLGLCSPALEDTLRKMLQSNHLPIAPSLIPSIDRLWQDKKNDRNRAAFILPDRIGHCEVYEVNQKQAEAWFAMAFEDRGNKWI